MSKFNNLNPEIALAPFKAELGENYPKIVADVKSMLGRVEKDIVTKDSEWKASTTFKLSNKEGRTVQLPLNNPASILLCFGMRLNELSKNGVFDIQATIPKNCTAWVEQHKRNQHAGAPVATA